MLEVDGNPKYNANEKIEKKEKYTDFADLINTFYDAEMKLINNDKEEQVLTKLDKNINIVPKIVYDKYSNEMNRV